jgi:hypothetical protein
MNTQAKVSGALATLLVLCTAPIPSYAVTADRNGSFQPAVQHGGDTSDLLVTAAARGGGRAGGGAGARGGGGGGRAAAANRGGGGGAAAANRGAGDRQVRSQAASNINHNRAGNANLSNRNINANNVGNRNVNNFNNVNVSGDFDGGWNGGWDDDYHPFAAAAVVGGTAALVGSMVNSIPPSCAPVVVNGATYSQCGSTWYQPQYAGTSVQYEVVNPPQ